jgi:hypothetical protein
MNSKEQETFDTSMEKALIEEYLNDQGYCLEKLQHLPERVVKYLMKEATRYAALKMEEIKAKAHLVKTMHEGAVHHKSYS